MPLTKEGQIYTAINQRKSDQRFISKFGAEKLQHKLATEGIYAYGFANGEDRDHACEQLFELSEECLWGDEKLQRQYGPFLTYRRWFDFSFYNSTIPEIKEILSIVKPFPKEHFGQRLRDVGIVIQEVPVYRFADLSDEEILSLKGGVLWHSYGYLDASKVIKR